MSKCTEEFELAVAQQYLTGTEGYDLVAHSHNLPDSTTRTGGKLYRAHGMCGLAKKYSHYSADFRLAVLLRFADLSYRQVAATFNIRNVGPDRIGSAAIIAAV